MHLLLPSGSSMHDGTHIEGESVCVCVGGGGGGGGGGIVQCSMKALSR